MMMIICKFWRHCHFLVVRLTQNFMEKEKLGLTILEQNMSEENCCLSGSQCEYPDTSSSFESSMYLNLVQLSKYLEENGLNIDITKELTDEQHLQIMLLVEKLLDDLKSNGKEPSLRIGPGPRYYHVYRVITYALLVLEHSNKEIYDKLKSSYDSLLQTTTTYESTPTFSSTKSEISTPSNIQFIDTTDKEAEEKTNQLIKYLIEYFNLPADTTIYDVLSQIKISHLINPEEKDDRIHALEAENRRLVGMIQTPTIIFDSNETPKIPDAKPVVDVYKIVEDNNNKNEIEKLKSEISLLKAQLESSQQNEKSKSSMITDLTEQISKLKDQVNRNDSNDAKIFVLETDNNVLQMKVNDLTEDNKRKRDKNRDLHNKIKLLKQEYQNQQVEIESLKMQNDKLQVDLDESQAQLRLKLNNSASEADLEAKNAEISKLNVALDELAEQQQDTLNDLATENDTKNRLYSLLQKQNLVVADLENQISDMRKQVEEKTERCKQVQQKLNEVIKQNEENKCNHQEVVYKLLEFIESLQENNEILNLVSGILKNNQNNTDKIIKSFEILYNNSGKLLNQNKTEDEKSLQSKNERLLVYICNLVHFIDQVANSQDIQDWLIGDSLPDFRSKLLAQVTHIETFMKANKLFDENQEIADIFAHFPQFIKSNFEKNGMFANENCNEYIAIIQMFTLANEILAKFSEELQNRGQMLMGEMKTMSNELQRLNDNINEKIEDATFELNSKLMTAQNDFEVLSDKVAKAQNLLRKESTNPYANNTLNFKLLGILSSQTEFPEEEEDAEFLDEIPNKQLQDYIKALESKIHQILENQQHVDEEYTSQISDLQKDIEELQNEKDILAEQKSDIENFNLEKIHELEEEIEGLKNQLEKLLEDYEMVKAENAELKATTEEQLKHISEIGELRKKEKAQQKAELEANYQKELKELQDAMNDLQKLFEEKEQQTKEEMKLMTNQAKEDQKRYQSEIEMQTKRANEIRNHYEPILADLRTKLSDARMHETQAQDELFRVTSENKDLKSQLSSTRVDAKMLQMKLNASEEKMKREKKLAETQFSMKLLAMETDSQNKFDNYKADMEAKNHALFVKVCELFKEFVDFGEAISSESVYNLLKRVSDKLNKSAKRDADLQKLFNEQTEVRNLLKIAPGQSVIQGVSAAAAKCDEFEKRKKKLEEDEKEVSDALKKARVNLSTTENSKEWEEWAKRMSAIVSENFSSTKNNQEIRFTLEEALMNSIGQRQIWRRIDILRAEKQLLQSNMIRNALKANKQPELSLTTMMSVVIPIRRLQKLSGHLKCAISIPKLDGSMPKKQTKEDKKYTWPILVTK